MAAQSSILAGESDGQRGSGHRPRVTESGTPEHCTHPLGRAWPGVECWVQRGAGSSPGQPPPPQTPSAGPTSLLLVKILKLIINELSSAREANAGPPGCPRPSGTQVPCVPTRLPAHCSGAHLAGPRGAGFQGLPAARPPFRLASLGGLSACSRPPAQSELTVRLPGGSAHPGSPWDSGMMQGPGTFHPGQSGGGEVRASGFVSKQMTPTTCGGPGRGG